MSQNRITKTDSEIVRLLQSKDPSQKQIGAKALYLNQYQIVESYLVSKGASSSDVKDVFQEGIAILYVQIKSGKYKQDAKLSTYLIGICKRLWFKHLIKNQKLVYTQDFDHKEEDFNTIHEEIAQDQKINAVLDVLKQLSVDCQKVLKLFYYQRKTMEDIADLLGYKGAQSAKNKKHKCLKYLKTKIKANNSVWQLFEIG